MRQHATSVNALGAKKKAVSFDVPSGRDGPSQASSCSGRILGGSTWTCVAGVFLFLAALHLNERRSLRRPFRGGILVLLITFKDAMLYSRQKLFFPLRLASLQSGNAKQSYTVIAMHRLASMSNPFLTINVLLPPSRHMSKQTRAMNLP